MLEYIGASFLYSILKDIWAAIRGRKRRLKPEQVLELRQKWKKEIEPILWERAQKKLGLDVVVRDVKRITPRPSRRPPYSSRKDGFDLLMPPLRCPSGRP
jgi:hypothetical protein